MLGEGHSRWPMESWAEVLAMLVCERGARVPAPYSGGEGGGLKAPATSALLPEQVPYPLPFSTAPSPPPVLPSRGLGWGGVGWGETDNPC